MPIPADLTEAHTKSGIPDALTYGQAIGLWADDRAAVDILNAKLEAIRKLSDGKQ